MPEDKKLLIDLNKDNLARVIGFGPIYDGKAKFVLTLILALTAYLLTELPRYVTAHAKQPTNPWFVLLDVACFLCFGSFIWATILIVQTIRPNVSRHSQKHSPLFFQQIAQVPLEEFRTTMTSMTPDHALALLAEQTYDNAKVMEKKNARVHNAVNLFLCGMTCFLLFTVGQAILLAIL